MAATYDVTLATGGTNTVGTLESVAQLQAFIITVKNDSDTAVDLRANDGAYGSLYDLILREVQPLMAFAPNDATGVIRVIVDGHAVDAATLQLRIRNIASATPSANDSTVTLGTSFTVA
jgi:hypothetical protein